MSYLDALIAIISMAQQARPNVTGQIDERRAQLTILSTVVSRTGISGSYSAMVSNQKLSFVSPIKDALAPDVDVAGQHDQKEQQHLDEAKPTQFPQGHREGIQEGDLDVEQQKDHRDQIELDRMTFAGVADRGHPAFIRRQLFGRGLSRRDEMRANDVDGAESRAKHQHDQDRNPAVHANRKDRACECFLKAGQKKSGLVRPEWIFPAENFSAASTTECYHTESCRFPVASFQFAVKAAGKLANSSKTGNWKLGTDKIRS